MSVVAVVVPDEIWRRILEIGTEQVNNNTTNRLNYKDLCCLSISCRRFNRLSNEDSLWSTLLSLDFPLQIYPPPSSSSTPSPPSKTLYKIRFQKDRARKLGAHRRAVLRVESQIGEHSRKLQQIEHQRAEESEKLRAAVVELSNLQKVRQASVALNVWQPEVIRGRQKQLVEQCVVPVDTRISALVMELKLCKQQIGGLDKAYRDENRRLDATKEQLSSMKYHPLRDNNLTSSGFDECGIKRKKLKKSHNCPSSAGQAPVEPVVSEGSMLSRPIPILDSTGDSLPPVITSDLSQVYTRRPRPSDPLPTSSPDSAHI